MILDDLMSTSTWLLITITFIFIVQYYDVRWAPCSAESRSKMANIPLTKKKPKKSKAFQLETAGPINVSSRNRLETNP